MPKRILYLGLDPSRYPHNGEIVHVPIIKIVPKPFVGAIIEAFAKLQDYTYILLTSRTAATLFKEFAIQAGYKEMELRQKKYLSIGKATAQRLSELELTACYISNTETAEGIIAMIDLLSITDPLFFPHSAQGRKLIHRYLTQKKSLFISIPIYDTVTNLISLPPLDSFDEIIFTSPSTVFAFLQLEKCLPPLNKCRAIGPQTREALTKIAPMHLKCYQNFSQNIL